MLDNILASKLYRPGSVAYVSRSGGMSNELNNIISRTTDGVYEGVAIGGDRYVFKSTSLTFMHLADAFIQSDLQCIPWELNPQSFALLTQCSNHWATGTSLMLHMVWCIVNDWRVSLNLQGMSLLQVSRLCVHGSRAEVSGHTRSQNDCCARWGEWAICDVYNHYKICNTLVHISLCF